MRVTVDGVVRSGDAVELGSFDVDERVVVRAVRVERTTVGGIRVDCPPPGAVHDYVGLVRPAMSVSIRSALAAVARQRGVEAPQDDELAAVRAELSSLSVPPVELASARKRASAVDPDGISRLREEVAAHRGAVQARQELDVDPTPARNRLHAAASRLSETVTDRDAAEQSLARARERARQVRDVRERRLELQDREGNLERAAREHLAGELAGEFAEAVDAVPGHGAVASAPRSFEGNPVTAGLAIARLASLRAPVVLSADVFGAAREASRVLDAPVLRV